MRSNNNQKHSMLATKNIYISVIKTCENQTFTAVVTYVANDMLSRILLTHTCGKTHEIQVRSMCEVGISQDSLRYVLVRGSLGPTCTVVSCEWS